MWSPSSLVKSLLIGMAAAAMILGNQALAQAAHPWFSVSRFHEVTVILGGMVAFLSALALLLREQAKLSLAKEQKGFAEAVIRNLPALACVVDAEGGLRLWNTNFEKTLGYSASEIELIRISSTVAPEHQDLFKKAMEETLQAGAADFEASLLTKQGRKIPCYLTGVRIFVDGRPCALGIAVDMSERKSAEEKLRQSEAHYRSLVANIPEVLWTMDRERRIKFVSPSIEKITGYSLAELDELGESAWLDSIHAEDRRKVAEAFDLLFASGKPFDMEYRLRNKKGQWIWVHGRSVSTHEDNGMQYADGLLSDITDRRLAQDALRQLAAIVDSSQDAITSTTSDDVLTSWNRGAERIYGYLRPRRSAANSPSRFRRRNRKK